jgi:hypothetical protein
MSRVFRTFFDVATRLWFWRDMELARALRLGRIATIPAGHTAYQRSCHYCIDRRNSYYEGLGGDMHA